MTFKTNAVFTSNANNFYLIFVKNNILIIT